MELSLSVVVFLCIVLVLLVAPPLVGRINVIGTTEDGSGWYLGIPPCTTWTRLGGIEYIPAYHQLGYNVQWDYVYELHTLVRNVGLLPVWVTFSRGSVPSWSSLTVNKSNMLIMPGQEVSVVMRYVLSSAGFDGGELPDISVGGDMNLKVLSLVR